MAWSWIRPKEEMLALAKEAAYAEILREKRAHVDYWKENFSDTPTQRTGWRHNYVCPQCAGYLDYSPDKPQEHTCPDCGITVENTPKVLEAWVYMRRFEIVNTLPEAALLYTLYGDETDRAFITRVIDFYAEHYVEFEEYGVYAGRGRIMGQSLDEAVWAVNAMKALLMIGYDGKSEEGQRWYKRLFLPIARLTVAQSSMIHNIPLWHAACAFAAGTFFDDMWLVDRTLDGELGLRNQILKGFTADGVWYENTVGYHHYSLMASTNVCLFARYAGLDEKCADLYARVVQAYTALVDLRFRDGTLPAFNDSSRIDSDQGLRGRTDMYLEAARLFADMPGVEAIDAVAGEYDVYGTLGAFLYGVPAQTTTLPAPGSVNLPHNCLAMLRNEDLEVFCKYGNLTTSHAHPDALEVCFPPFACDPGNPGYGSPFHNGWYKQTLSHSTFVIDGKSQKPDAYGQGALSADGKAFTCQVDDAYEGVSAKRELSVRENVLTDRMSITCDKPRQIDWVFHSEGEAVFEGKMEESKLPETENGYGYLSSVRRVEGAFSAKFTFGNQVLSLQYTSLPEGAAIYLAKSPGNPATSLRDTVIVRTLAPQAVIEASFTFTQN